MLREPEQVAAAPGAGVREKAAGIARALTAAAEMCRVPSDGGSSHGQGSEWRWHRLPPQLVTSTSTLFTM